MPNDEFLLVDFDVNENSIVNHTNDPRGHQYCYKNKKGLLKNLVFSLYKSGLYLTICNY